MEPTQRIAKLLLDQRTTDGHWVGELSASALSTATAVSALSFYAKDHPDEKIQPLIGGGLRWLVNEQNADGGWGDTDKNYSNISTSMLAVAAMVAAEKIAGGREIAEIGGVRTRAENYIQSVGGVAAVKRRYGKDKTFAVPILANCAMAGIVPWKEVSALPFEAACVPQRFYHALQLPVVSYAIPALVAIGQCKFVNDPPWDPVRRLIRRSAIGRSLKVLERMQPQSGGYLEAIPLTSFVCMALIESGRAGHGVVENGIRFLIQSVRETEEEGCCWPIDTNLATWGTTLAINALAGDDQDFAARVNDQPEVWRGCFDWLLECQNQTVHPFTGSPPGGWGWTDLSGSVPDADDTPGALIALKHVLDVCQPTGAGHKIAARKQLNEASKEKFGEDFQRQIIAAADGGIDWLLKLQNRDQGWPTFCRGWSNLPFDRSGADLTAHVVRSLGAWRDVEGLSVSRSRLDRAIDSGVGYLCKTQRQDGSWLPLWFGNQDFQDDLNPFYGTAKVIQAFADLDLLDTKAPQIGLDWIVDHQNDDGGFGGGASVKFADDYPDFDLGHSSVEETALCTDALLNSGLDRHRQAALAGVAWMQSAVAAGVIETCHPIGFYFAKLWYHEKLYPLVFSMSAMAKFTREQREGRSG